MNQPDGPSRSVENPSGTLPTAPAGHPDAAQATPPDPTVDTANATQPEDLQAFLESQPEEHRAALAALPPEALQHLRKGTMLQSDYSQKRGVEAAQVRALEQQNQLLQQQVAATSSLLERAAQGTNGQPAGHDPTALAKALYEAGTPEEYLQNLQGVVAPTVEEQVAKVLESHPAMRQLQATVALGEVAQSAPEGATDADVRAGIASMRASLQARGVDMAQLEGAALVTLSEPHIEAAKVRRELGEVVARAKQGAPVRPVTPSVTGTGAAPPPVAPSDRQTFDHNATTVDQRIAATTERLGLTPQQLQQILRSS